MPVNDLRRRLVVRDETGQGLIELIVALTLLAIAIGALLTVATSSAVSLQRSDQKGTALMLAEQQIELYRNLTFAHIQLDSTSLAHTDSVYANAHASDATIPSGPAGEVSDSTTLWCTPDWPSTPDSCNPSRNVLGPDNRNYRVDTYIVNYQPQAGAATIKQVTVVVRNSQISSLPILARASSTFSSVDAVSGKAQPKLTVAAPAAAHIGDVVTPTAAITGGSGPNGSIQWFVLGPQDTAPVSCVSSSWGQVGSPLTVSGNGSYTDGSGFTPGSAGTYWWYATYSGDSGNNSINSGCTSTKTVVTNGQTVPTLHLTAVPSFGTKNQAFTASSVSAQIAGGNSPTGAINFYVSTNPGSAPACPGGAWTLAGTAAATGNGTYNPASITFTPTSTGTYYWYAEYAGDSNNAAVKTCSDSASTTPVGNETFTVTLNTASPWTTGTAFSITVKAILGDASTVDSGYSGSKTLVLTGPGTSPGGTGLSWPATVSFSNGQATFNVSAFKAETTTLSVLDGTLVISGTSPSFTVQTGAASKLAWTSTSVSSSSLSAGCYFSCTWSSAGNNKTFKATVSVTDAYGNIVSNIGAGHTVTFGKNAGSWSSATLSLPSAGAATTASNTYTTPNGGGWPAGNTASATATSLPYLGATLTVNR
jgi:type II secretory pathway pseudopilin PulG